MSYVTSHKTRVEISTSPIDNHDVTIIHNGSPYERSGKYNRYEDARSSSPIREMKSRSYKTDNGDTVVTVVERSPSGLNPQRRVFETRTSGIKPKYQEEEIRSNYLSRSGEERRDYSPKRSKRAVEFRESSPRRSYDNVEVNHYEAPRREVNHRYTRSPQRKLKKRTIIEVEPEEQGSNYSSERSYSSGRRKYSRDRESKMIYTNPPMRSTSRKREIIETATNRPIVTSTIYDVDPPYNYYSPSNSGIEIKTRVEINHPEERESPLRYRESNGKYSSGYSKSKKSVTFSNDGPLYSAGSNRMYDSPSRRTNIVKNNSTVYIKEREEFGAGESNSKEALYENGRLVSEKINGVETGYLEGRGSRNYDSPRRGRNYDSPRGISERDRIEYSRNYDSPSRRREYDSPRRETNFRYGASPQRSYRNEERYVEDIEYSPKRSYGSSYRKEYLGRSSNTSKPYRYEKTIYETDGGERLSPKEIDENVKAQLYKSKKEMDRALIRAQEVVNEAFSKLTGGNADYITPVKDKVRRIFDRSTAGSFVEY